MGDGTMSIWTGYAGIITTFVILGTLLLWLLIKSKIHIFVKILIVPVVLWYSLVLYYVPEKLLGWPTPDDIPDRSAVFATIIKEPGPSDQGAIYIWLMDIDGRKKTNWANPKNVFEYSEKNAPRSYKLPYSRGLHEELQKGEEARERGMIIMLKKGGKGAPKEGNNGARRRSDADDVEIEILNPQLFIPKE
ncbi:hypothetical protein A2468_02040 [Candidatus Falkowbacteria bacterium RIFOXYC2_FULL_46_15]|uniref:Uncharacterized protein n=1 Tax=Candidatus Falkowbacteria bacterium RIFOXYA2_FULL_47_19 TaxID=1797994 RepID=A0A1F5SF29_9BACT|nr:MAG: hypothetical protein A2227_07770 [Candidatus Falkowbacteria bacterium RIFOXYA2_FULL_47_19]OGF35194.1 MAG: hypothetical protein A2468_02040 [Candidatus Falkowbacteria bacterium RIFOXYC2_FULL_46_15]